MPLIQTAPDLQTWYRIDDFTDPWTNAPWVVLMHGIAENSDAWYAWIPYFARRYRVLRFDLRGYGRSTPMPRDHDWSLDEIGQDLGSLLHHLNIDQCHLVAAKVGGTMALHFASNGPHALKSLTVLGTPATTASATDLGYSSQEIDTLGVGHWVRRTMHNRLGTVMPPEAQEWWARMMETTPASTQSGFMRLLPHIDIRDRLPKIKCPTLVITTGSSENEAQNITGLNVTRSWQSTIPRSELKVIANDSFHVAATAPDVAAGVTLEFIDKHETSAGNR